MAEKHKTDAIEATGTSSVQRKNYWQAWQDAYDKMFSGEPIPHAQVTLNSKDTISSAKEPEKVAKKGIVTEGYLSYLWNVMTSPLKFEGSTGVSQVEKVGSITKSKGSSPLEPPAPIDMSAAKLFIKEMRQILDRAQEESNQEIERQIVEVLKNHIAAYKTGIGSGMALSIRLGDEEKHVKAGLRWERSKVDEITGKSAFYGKINTGIKYTSTIFTVGAIALDFYKNRDFSRAKSTAVTVSSVCFLAADTITNFMKAGLDRQLGQHRAEMITLKGQRDLLQFRKKDYLDQIQRDDRCVMDGFKLMNQLATNALQTGQIVLSNNTASGA